MKFSFAVVACVVPWFSSQNSIRTIARKEGKRKTEGNVTEMRGNIDYPQLKEFAQKQDGSRTSL